MASFISQTTGSNTFTVPKYVYEITIELTGGGGGSGHAASGSRGTLSGGGGASGSVLIKTISVKEKNIINYTIGGGGGLVTDGENTAFTYENITYTAKGGGGGGSATTSVDGSYGQAGTPTGGDTNIPGINGQGAGGVAGHEGGQSVGTKGYGAGGDGSTNPTAQNFTSGDAGGILITYVVKTPAATTSSGGSANTKNITLGGNKMARTKDESTGKSRIQASIIDSSVVLNDTSTKFMLGGMPLTVKKSSNGNYVLHIYDITTSTPTYTPSKFTKSSDPSLFAGTDIDVFKSTDGKRVLALDRLVDQEDLSGLSTLNSSSSTKNAIMWLGTPFLVNDDNVFLVSISDSDDVDEFVTTYFMGLPFLVARQGTNYLLCALLDDSNIDIENL